MRWSRRRARASRTASLAAVSGLATAALGGAEVLRVWRRGRSGSANETAVLNLFLSFGATFGVARAVTHSIRRGAGPLRNIEIGHRHIHHFVPGIVLVLLSRGISIGLRRERFDHWLAVPFGAGAALIVDERRS
jgi:hypothetical protein